jgi:EmrB/QacA subfamily drug resistance transporter
MQTVLDEPRRARTARRWLVLALLAGAQLMLVLDVTVVNVALPDIGAALGLARGTVPWVLTTYTVTFGGLMLLGGRIADLVGARRVVLAGLALFTAASLLCGLAGGPVELLAGRALQGLAAAFLSPAALSLVTAAFPGPERGKALAVWSSLAGAGSALGVVLGGVLTSEISWRWIFTVNVPIGVALLAALPVLTTETRQSRTAHARVDVLGAALVTTGTGAAIYALVNAGPHGWTAASTLVASGLALAQWVAFARVERRAAHPLLAVGLLRRRAVSGGAFLMVTATGLLVGGYFLASFDLQRGYGYSAVHVGLVFLPVAVATILGAQGAGHLLQHVDARTVGAAGLALAAGGYAAALAWDGPAGVVTGLAIASLGIGATFVTAFTASLADAAPDESGLRSAIVATFHELGGALGVAVLATSAGAALGAGHVAPSEFGRAFTVAAVVAAVAVPVAALLVPAVRRPAAAGRPGH